MAFHKRRIPTPRGCQPPRLDDVGKVVRAPRAHQWLLRHVHGLPETFDEIALFDEIRIEIEDPAVR